MHKPFPSHTHPLPRPPDNSQRTPRSSPQQRRHCRHPHRPPGVTAPAPRCHQGQPVPSINHSLTLHGATLRRQLHRHLHQASPYHQAQQHGHPPWPSRHHQWIMDGTSTTAPTTSPQCLPHPKPSRPHCFPSRMLWLPHRIHVAHGHPQRQLRHLARPYSSRCHALFPEIHHHQQGTPSPTTAKPSLHKNQPGRSPSSTTARAEQPTDMRRFCCDCGCEK
jgi:hypothetical protein